MDNPLRLGVIGVGHWGRRLIRAFGEAGVVVACAHRGAAGTRDWLAAESPHLRIEPDAAALAAARDVDVVVVASPPATHAEMALLAIRAGKPVFVEKPLALSAAGAEAVAREAQRHGVCAFVGNVFLHHPVFGRLQEIAREDPIRQVRLAWEKFGSFEEDIHWNLVWHEVAIATALMGACASDTWVALRRGWRSHADEVEAGLRFPGERTAWISTHRASPRKRKSVCTLHESGRLRWWEEGELAEADPGGPFRVVWTSDAEPLVLQARTFVAAVRADRTGLADGQLSLDVARTVELLARPLTRPRT